MADDDILNINIEDELDSIDMEAIVDLESQLDSIDLEDILDAEVSEGEASDTINIEGIKYLISHIQSQLDAPTYNLDYERSYDVLEAISVEEVNSSVVDEVKNYLETEISRVEEESGIGRRLNNIRDFLEGKTEYCEGHSQIDNNLVHRVIDGVPYAIQRDRADIRILSYLDGVWKDLGIVEAEFDAIHVNAAIQGSPVDVEILSPEILQFLTGSSEEQAEDVFLKQITLLDGEGREDDIYPISFNNFADFNRELYVRTSDITDKSETLEQSIEVEWTDGTKIQLSRNAQYGYLCHVGSDFNLKRSSLRGLLNDDEFAANYKVGFSADDLYEDNEIFYAEGSEKPALLKTLSGLNGDLRQYVSGDIYNQLVDLSDNAKDILSLGNEKEYVAYIRDYVDLLESVEIVDNPELIGYVDKLIDQSKGISGVIPVEVSKMERLGSYKHAFGVPYSKDRNESPKMFGFGYYTLEVANDTNHIYLCSNDKNEVLKFPIVDTKRESLRVVYRYVQQNPYIEVSESLEGIDSKVSEFTAITNEEGYEFGQSGDVFYIRKEGEEDTIIESDSRDRVEALFNDITNRANDIGTVDRQFRVRDLDNGTFIDLGGVVDFTKGDTDVVKEIPFVRGSKRGEYIIADLETQAIVVKSDTYDGLFEEFENKFRGVVVPEYRAYQRKSIEQYINRTASSNIMDDAHVAFVTFRKNEEGNVIHRTYNSYSEAKAAASKYENAFAIEVRGNPLYGSIPEDYPIENTLALEECDTKYIMARMMSFEPGNSKSMRLLSSDLGVTRYAFIRGDATLEELKEKTAMTYSVSLKVQEGNKFIGFNGEGEPIVQDEKGVRSTCHVVKVNSSGQYGGIYSNQPVSLVFNRDNGVDFEIENKQRLFESGDKRYLTEREIADMSILNDTHLRVAQAVQQEQEQLRSYDIATVFGSGLTRSPADIDKAVADGKNIGVAASGLGANVKGKLIDAANSGLKVFVDTGGFTAFTKGVDLDTDLVIANYKELLEGVTQENRGNFYFVAPDVIGDQAATYELVKDLGAEMDSLMDQGANVIVPVQRGEVEPIPYMGDVTNEFKTENAQNIIWGIPYNKVPFTQDEVLSILENRPETNIHLLGGGSAKVEGLVDAAILRGIDVSGIHGDSMLSDISQRKHAAVKAKKVTAAEESLGNDVTTGTFTKKADAISIEDLNAINYGNVREFIQQYKNTSVLREYELTEGIGKNTGKEYYNLKCQADNEKGEHCNYKLRIPSQGNPSVKFTGKTDGQLAKEDYEKYEALKDETKSFIHASGLSDIGGNALRMYYLGHTIENEQENWEPWGLTPFGGGQYIGWLKDRYGLSDDEVANMSTTDSVALIKEEFEFWNLQESKRSKEELSEEDLRELKGDPDKIEELNAIRGAMKRKPNSIRKDDRGIFIRAYDDNDNSRYYVIENDESILAIDESKGAVIAKWNTLIARMDEAEKVSAESSQAEISKMQGVIDRSNADKERIQAEGKSGELVLEQAPIEVYRDENNVTYVWDQDLFIDKIEPFKGKVVEGSVNRVIEDAYRLSPNREVITYGDEIAIMNRGKSPDELTLHEISVRSPGGRLGQWHVKENDYLEKEAHDRVGEEYDLMSALSRSFRSEKEDNQGLKFPTYEEWLSGVRPVFDGEKWTGETVNKSELATEIGVVENAHKALGEYLQSDDLWSRMKEKHGADIIEEVFGSDLNDIYKPYVYNDGQDGKPIEYAVPDENRKVGIGFGDTIFESLERVDKEREGHVNLLVSKHVTAKELDQAEQQAAEDERKEIESFQGFLSDSPMQAARQRRFFKDTYINTDGRPVALKDFIEMRIDEGYYVTDFVDSTGDTKILTNSEGQHYDISIIGKTGMDYAEHYMNLNPLEAEEGEEEEADPAIEALFANNDEAEELEVVDEESVDDGIAEENSLNNYSYDKGVETQPRGRVTRIKSNIKAIRLLKKLESEDRVATDEEKEALAAYSGWGADKEVFSTSYDYYRNMYKAPEGAKYKNNGERAEALYPSYYSEAISWEKNYGDYYDQLKSLLTKEEFEAAADSTLNAHYTSGEMCHSLWDMAKHLGFKGGKVLEPACGTGKIIGAMPEEFRKNSTVDGVELDSLTARMAKKLYPDSNIENMGFEDSATANASFDLVITNVPFSQVKVGTTGLNLHNYFIAKSQDKLKPGGLSVVITSHSTMDNNRKQREFLSSKAEFLGGIRLPNDAFKGNANTEVVTDVLVFRKPDGLKVDTNGWLSTTDVLISEKESFTTSDDKNINHATINEYFARNPKMVIGDNSLLGKMYGGGGETGQYTVKPDGTTLKEAVGIALQSLPSNVPNPTNIENYKYNPTGKKVQGFNLMDGEFRKDKDTGEYVQIRSEKSFDGSYEFQSVELPWYDPAYKFPRGLKINKKAGLNTKQDVATAMTADYVALKSAFFKSLHGDLKEDTTEQESDEWRTSMNEAYDKYVSKWGTLSDSKVAARLFEKDPGFGSMLAMEEVSEDLNGEVTIAKADMLSKRTMFPTQEPKVETLEDAIVVSMSRYGNINSWYISGLLDKTPEEVEKEIKLSSDVYKDPITHQYIHRIAYVAGDVVTKLEEAQQAAEEDGEYKKNVEALEKVQPEVIPFSSITVNMGSSWVPMDVYQKFMREELGMSNYVKMNYYKGDSKFRFSNLEPWVSDKLRVEYSIPAYSGDKVFAAAMNQEVISVYTKDEKGRNIYQVEASEKANAMKDRLCEEFKNWLKLPEQDEVRRNIETEWNRSKNRFVHAKYEGSKMLEFPGLSSVFKPRAYQADTTQRLLMEGGGLVAHDVGFGKTLTAILTAQEAKRTGTVNGSMIVCDNANYKDFVATYRKMYPQAKLLVAENEDVNPKNRNRFATKVLTGDYDCILMKRSQFERFPCSPETINSFYQEQLDLYKDILEQAENNRESKSSVRDVRMRIRTIENKLKGERKNIEKNQDSSPIFFDALIDSGKIGQIIVDEAHRNKKSSIITKQKRVKGIDVTTSNRGIDLLIKSRMLHERRDGKGVVLLTATPATNTMAEFWSMLRFCQPKVLEMYGVDHIDRFFDTFCELKREIELVEATGRWKSETRLAKFVNGETLIQMIRTGFDVQNDPTTIGLKLPDLKTEYNVSKLTRPVAEILDTFTDIVEAYEQSSNKKDLSYVIPVLLQASVRAAIDPRLIDPEAPDHPNSLVNQLVNNLVKIDKENPGQAQAIFLDRYKTMNLSCLDQLMDKGVMDEVEMDENLVDADDPNGEEDEKEAAAQENEKEAPKFNLYHDIRAKLIAQGYQEDKIVIMSEIKDDNLKKKAQEDIRNGKIKFAIGSSDTLGIGVNIQNKLVAMHHVDVPQSLTPDAIRQRDGRGWRFGNTNDKVHRVVYGMEDTATAGAFHRIERKGKFIAQGLAGKGVGQEFEDPMTNIDDAKGAFVRDKRVLKMTEMQQELKAMRIDQEVHDTRIARISIDISRNERHLEIENRSLEKANEIQEILQPKFDIPELGQVKLNKEDKLHDFQFQWGSEKPIVGNEKEVFKAINEKIAKLKDFQLGKEGIEGSLTFCGMTYLVDRRVNTKNESVTLVLMPANKIEGKPPRELEMLSLQKFSNAKGLYNAIIYTQSEVNGLAEKREREIESINKTLDYLREEDKESVEYDTTEIDSLQKELTDLKIDLEKNPINTRLVDLVDEQEGVVNSNEETKEEAISEDSEELESHSEEQEALMLATADIEEFDVDEGMGIL